MPEKSCQRVVCNTFKSMQVLFVHIPLYKEIDVYNILSWQLILLLNHKEELINMILLMIRLDMNFIRISQINRSLKVQLNSTTPNSPLLLRTLAKIDPLIGCNYTILNFQHYPPLTYHYSTTTNPPVLHPIQIIRCYPKDASHPTSHLILTYSHPCSGCPYRKYRPTLNPWLISNLENLY